MHAIVQAAELRLRPVLMTALVARSALCPWRCLRHLAARCSVLSRRSSSAVISATLLIPFVLPSDLCAVGRDRRIEPTLLRPTSRAHRSVRNHEVQRKLG